ncbi:hypothetical protein BZG36_05053 [Bifiguratus adelaidae]|uniref:Homoserine kinase n=1 Tax=Bifiguratus adelaidae TaxID=1938954 RepID=A0A261XYQ8_9FUNG|nr:hypothetical protein BZG36_05053 [Bifiguratus adelaidae]
MTRRVRITVPCSTANIGPGFDVLGASLSLYLTLDVSWLDGPTPAATSVPVTPYAQVTYSGEGTKDVSLDPSQNLITRTALYVLRSQGVMAFPAQLSIHAHNDIPLGRGLGSSGAAVVAGVMLGDVLGGFNMSKDRMLDYCLMVERHPDNVAAALIGGFVASYLRELSPEDTEAKSIPLSETLDHPMMGKRDKPPQPPHGIGHYIKLNWQPEIKAIAIIPKFEVATAKARAVLPTSYDRPDVVFNFQRLAVLTSALGRSPPDADLIWQAMQDKIHQPYRKHLIPGLPEVFATITPKTYPGFLGVCLSGAGPTILALAVDNFEQIAANVQQVLKNTGGIDSTWTLLELEARGAHVQDLLPQ